VITRPSAPQEEEEGRGDGLRARFYQGQHEIQSEKKRFWPPHIHLALKKGEDRRSIGFLLRIIVIQGKRKGTTCLKFRTISRFELRLAKRKKKGKGNSPGKPTHVTILLFESEEVRKKERKGEGKERKGAECQHDGNVAIDQCEKKRTTIQVGLLR